MGEHVRVYSDTTRDTLTMLGHTIRLARKERRMALADLAARMGIARGTFQAIERGNPSVEIGLVFEAAVLLGVPLFVDEPSQLAPEISRLKDKLALHPYSTADPERRHAMHCETDTGLPAPTEAFV